MKIIYFSFIIFFMCNWASSEEMTPGSSYVFDFYMYVSSNDEGCKYIDKVQSGNERGNDFIYDIIALSADGALTPRLHYHVELNEKNKYSFSDMKKCFIVHDDGSSIECGEVGVCARVGLARVDGFDYMQRKVDVRYSLGKLISTVGGAAYVADRDGAPIKGAFEQNMPLKKDFLDCMGVLLGSGKLRGGDGQRYISFCVLKRQNISQ